MEIEEIKKHGFETVKNYKVVKRVLIAVNLVGKNNKVLELGCRTGEVTKFFLENNDVIGIDVVPEFIHEARKLKGNYIIWDIDKNEFPFRDETFDVVFMGETLEYLHNRESCIKEIYRVLKKDGKLIITEINLFSLRRRLKFISGNQPYDLKHFIHFFHYKELEKLLTDNRFKITKWLNQGTNVKGVKLPFAFKGSCDTWVVEARK